MNERSAAVPTARVSAGLPSVTASETAESDVAMYCDGSPVLTQYCRPRGGFQVSPRVSANRDRKSTRLNSSHGYISYAVFCLKKKNISSHGRRANRGNGIQQPRLRP